MAPGKRRKRGNGARIAGSGERHDRRPGFGKAALRQRLDEPTQLRIGDLRRRRSGGEEPGNNENGGNQPMHGTLQFVELLPALK
jgi:hypothetical protein